MAEAATIAREVARLFAAASRQLGWAELDSYRDALADVGDEELKLALDLLVANEAWVGQRPSPALVRAYVRRVRDAASRARAAPEETEPVTPRAEIPARIAWLRQARYEQPKENA
jgi:hypothetical protein